MGARLVGDDVGLEAGLEHPRQRARRRCRAGRPTPPGPSSRAAAQRAIASSRSRGLLVQVARLQPPLDPPLVDLHAQRDAAVHRHRQRLRAAHPAEPGGQRDRPRQRAAVAPARDLGEALVGALHDALGADVDPRPRGHLPVHRQPEVLEPAELVPASPTPARGSSWRSAPAAPTRACASRRPACPTARAASRRPPASAAPARSRRTPPTNAPRARCRRRRRGRRAARRRPGRGCS